MPFASSGSGRVTASQNDVIIQPRISTTGRRPIVYCHSAGMSGLEGGGYSQLPSVEKLLSGLAGYGYTIVSVSTGTSSWGNGAASDTASTTSAMGRIQAGLDYARSTLGCSSQSPIIIGSSMGTIAAQRYAMLHPTSTAAIICMLTLPSITTIYNNNLNSLRAGIESAYGVTYPAALPSGADPALTGYGSVPIYASHASDDILWTTNSAGSSWVSAYASNITELNVGALGHTDAAVAAVNPNTVFDWLVSKNAV